MDWTFKEVDVQGDELNGPNYATVDVFTSVLTPPCSLLRYVQAHTDMKLIVDIYSIKNYR